MLQERRRNWSVVALTRSLDISNERIAMVIMFYENAPRRSPHMQSDLQRWMVLDKGETRVNG